MRSITRAATLIGIIPPLTVTATPARSIMGTIAITITGACIPKSTDTRTSLHFIKITNRRHFITSLSGNSAVIAIRKHLTVASPLTGKGLPPSADVMAASDIFGEEILMRAQ